MPNETPQPNQAEEEKAIPDWAIAVIVIGLGSIAFVIIFGITVVRNRSCLNNFPGLYVYGFCAPPQLTNRRRRILSNKKRQEASHHANLTQDMLNELNKHTLPGYEHYLHYPSSSGGGPPAPLHGGSPYDDYDTDAAWNNDRYYGGSGGSGGQRYKVRDASFVCFETRLLGGGTFDGIDTSFCSFDKLCEYDFLQWKT